MNGRSISDVIAKSLFDYFSGNEGMYPKKEELSREKIHLLKNSEMQLKQKDIMELEDSDKLEKIQENMKLCFLKSLKENEDEQQKGIT
jgi:hypothetical protein